MLATIGLVIDAVILLSLIIFGVIGYKKGFLKSILSLFSWVFCLVVAVLVAKHVAGWLNGIYDFAGLIGNKVTKSLGGGEFFGAAINTFADKKALIDAIPSSTNPVFKQLIVIIFNNNAIDFTSSQTVGQVTGGIAGQLIMILISGILVFAILMLVMFLLNKLINKITSNRVIGSLNKILGLILGVVKGAVIIVAFNIMLVLLAYVPFINNSVTPFISDNTHVEKFVYKTTDKVVDKYFVNGDFLKDYIVNIVK